MSPRALIVSQFVTRVLGTHPTEISDCPGLNFGVDGWSVCVENLTRTQFDHLQMSARISRTDNIFEHDVITIGRVTADVDGEDVSRYVRIEETVDGSDKMLILLDVAQSESPDFSHVDVREADEYAESVLLSELEDQLNNCMDAEEVQQLIIRRFDLAVVLVYLEPHLPQREQKAAERPHLAVVEK